MSERELFEKWAEDDREAMEAAMEKVLAKYGDMKTNHDTQLEAQGYRGIGTGGFLESGFYQGWQARSQYAPQEPKRGGLSSALLFRAYDKVVNQVANLIRRLDEDTLTKEQERQLDRRYRQHAKIGSRLTALLEG